MTISLFRDTILNMETGMIEILLIELAGASIKNKLAWRHSIFRSAPIGLYCLKSCAPDRIAVIDTPVAQINDMIGMYAKEPVKAIILRLAEQPDEEAVRSVLEACRKAFPTAKFGCNNIQSDITRSFDFTIDGTGKTSILCILRGDIIPGFHNDFNNDRISWPEMPSAPLVDVGYSILSEKWLSTKGIEVWQPWLGLAEFSTTVFEYPGYDWMVSFLNWLNESGIDSVHFGPSKASVEEINRLRASLLKNKISVSLSFLSTQEIRYAEILIPLKRIWLYFPKAEESEEIVTKLKTIRDMGLETGLLINHSWFKGGITLPVCRYIDHLIVDDDYEWSNMEIKKITQRFWGTRTRFLRRLFSLKTASELINFMKSAYAMFDTLFLPDKKGEK